MTQTIQKIQPNSHQHLQQSVKIVILFLSGTALLSICLQQYNIIFSTVLGSGFSYIGLRQLIRTQMAILNKGKSALFFLSFINRLALYTIPILISLKYTAYFNIIVVLLCLFIFQFVYILETAFNIKKKHTIG